MVSPGRAAAASVDDAPSATALSRVEGWLVHDAVPVGGWKIELRTCPALVLVERATTDAGGRFVFDVPEAARYALFVAGPTESARGDFPSAWLRPLRPSTLEVAEGERRLVTLELPITVDATSIEGAIVDQFDEPVVGAHVALRSVEKNEIIVRRARPLPGCDGFAPVDARDTIETRALPHESQRLQIEARTDSDGRFRFEALPPGRYVYRVRPPSAELVGDSGVQAGFVSRPVEFKVRTNHEPEHRAATLRLVREIAYSVEVTIEGEIPSGSSVRFEHPSGVSFYIVRKARFDTGLRVFAPRNDEDSRSAECTIKFSRRGSVSHRALTPDDSVTFDLYDIEPVDGVRTKAVTLRVP